MGPGQVSAAAAMAGLGFTALEGEIYVSLLRESPATGYRVAQLIGKPVANTYKGLASLVMKGAAYVDDGGTKVYRAAPPKEVLGRLGQDFEAKRASAEAALARLGAPDGDARVYALATRDQILARATDMLAHCREVALAVAVPELLGSLREPLQDAAGRGADVVVKAFEPIELPGCEVVLSNQPVLIVEGSPAKELQVVVDASQHLVALLGIDRVLQAVWSASPFLSMVHHNGLAMELCLTQLIAGLRRRDRRRDLDLIVERMRHPPSTVGTKRLQGRDA